MLTLKLLVHPLHPLSHQTLHPPSLSASSFSCFPAAGFFPPESPQRSFSTCWSARIFWRFLHSAPQLILPLLVNADSAAAQQLLPCFSLTLSKQQQLPPRRPLRQAHLRFISDCFSAAAVLCRSPSLWHTLLLLRCLRSLLLGSAALLLLCE